MAKTSRLQVVFDFDGILSGMMLFGPQGKAYKQLQYDVRQGIDMLSWFDCDVYVLTGDSTKEGKAITEKMLANTKVKKILYAPNEHKLMTLQQTFGDLSKIVYSGDNLCDILIAPQIGVFMTHKDAMLELQNIADFVSQQSNMQYSFLDMCRYIVVEMRKARPEWFVQQLSYNAILPKRLLTIFNINKILLVGSMPNNDESLEAAKAWFNEQMFMLYGIKIEDIGDKIEVAYKNYTTISNADSSYNTMAIVMSDTVLLDVGQLMMLPKVVINFGATDLSYTDALVFMQRMTDAIKLLPSTQFMYHEFFLYMPYDTEQKLKADQDIADATLALLRGSYCPMPNPNDFCTYTTSCECPK